MALQLDRELSEDELNDLLFSSQAAKYDGRTRSYGPDAKDVDFKVCKECQRIKPSSRFTKIKRRRYKRTALDCTCRDCRNLAARGGKPPTQREVVDSLHHRVHAQYSSAYRARKRAATVEPVSYDEIYKRDKGICHICSKAVSWTEVEFDHVIPLSRGGVHSNSNIKISHSGCNRVKSDRLVGEFDSITST